MAIKTRAEIASVFEDDDFPTGGDFIDRADSFWHKTDDKIPIYTLADEAVKYDSDTDAINTGGLTVGEYYIAGDSHEDAVRHGTPCRVNNV